MKNYLKDKYEKEKYEMKIGIVTFHSAHNYGAVLQAWSLQEYLTQQGHEVEIINLRLPVIDKLYRLAYKTNRRICRFDAVNKCANGLYYLARSSGNLVVNPGKIGKYFRFEHFIKHKLPVTKPFYSLKELQQEKLQYDVLISGSDQVWNATMMTGINPAYFLQFANPDAIRVSYAASIGTEEIPPKYQLLFKRYLRDFDAISVREKKAKEQVQLLTDKEVELVADPTFLLKREDFDKLRKKSSFHGKYIYVHNVHLKRVDEALNSVAEEMSERLGLPIIHNWKKKVYKNEAGHFTGGVEEFLSLVSGAEYVITNSFHCTVFSIIYQKNFITVPHFKHPDRMKNLLEELGVPEHLIETGDKIPRNLEELTIDYDSVEKRRALMGLHAQEFLEKAIHLIKTEDRRSYLEIEDKFRCYGCGVCKEACPQKAIRMEPDEEGFLYPVVDKALCVQCGKCKEACIYQADTKEKVVSEWHPEIFLANAKDMEVRKSSAGSGIFTLMYRAALKQGGKVVGVCFDGHWNVLYDIADKEEDCKKFCGFKYVDAESGDIKQRVQEILKKGESVLFSGTPCQIAGLKKFLGRDYPNLCTVEMICQGAASPKAYGKYLDYMEELYKSKIVRLEFWNKFKGPDTPFILTEFESKSVDVELVSTNNFTRAYLNHNIQRPSCYTCEYAGSPEGTADISIGRYCGEKLPEFGEDCAVSILKINTPRGKDFFELWKEEAEVRASTFDEAYANTQTGPLTLFGTRGRLMYYLDEQPFEELFRTFNRFKKGRIKGI
ncbi:MAG: polysaccharide pyruvyl transferase family protein [Eubacteriales bacterium]|nr:polysaccharide pyruvyl transferase family protein [Eubacteriales bacterium]